jgi:hypothetical protein
MRSEIKSKTGYGVYKHPRTYTPYPCMGAYGGTYGYTCTPPYTGGVHGVYMGHTGTRAHGHTRMHAYTGGYTGCMGHTGTRLSVPQGAVDEEEARAVDEVLQVDQHAVHLSDTRP